MKLILPAAAVLLAASTALAQSNIIAANKRAYSENIGFLNFRDAGSPAASDGVRIYNTYFTGRIWAENVGWIRTGDGSPALAGPAGPQYANALVSGVLDYGVNVDATIGNLSGLAWGENIGWINFSGGAMATPAKPARIDYAAGNRLRGYAWSPNVGWINLDHASVYVRFTPLCPADFDHDGLVQPSDVAAFVNAWQASLTAGTLAGDFDGNGLVEPADVALFVTIWFNALSGGC